jgi:hypothetical protein
MRRRNVFAIVAMVLALALVMPVVFSAQSNAASKKKVKLNKTKATLVAGKTVQLKVQNSKKKVTWKSSNGKVATVSKKGLVTAKAPGKATITAKVGKKNLKCAVTVNETVTTLKCVGKRTQVKEFEFFIDDPAVYVKVKITATTNGITYKTSGASIGGYDGTGRYDAKFTGSAVIGDPYTKESGKEVPAQLTDAQKAAFFKEVVKKLTDTRIDVDYRAKASTVPVRPESRSYTLKTITAEDKNYDGIVSTFNHDTTTGSYTLDVIDLTIFEEFSHYKFSVYNKHNVADEN